MLFNFMSLVEKDDEDEDDEDDDKDRNYTLVRLNHLFCRRLCIYSVRGMIAFTTLSKLGLESLFPACLGCSLCNLSRLFKAIAG